MPTLEIPQIVRFAAVAALLTQIPASPLLAQCSQADKAALEAFDRSWGDASVRGDRAALESVMSANYMALNAAGAVDKATTITNVTRNAERNRANPVPAGTADRFVITCTPVSATITHRNVFVESAGSVPSYSRSVHFLEKQGGKWHVVSSTGHAVNEQQQLLYLEQDWNDAIKRHDADWIEKNYAPFASEISSETGAIKNRAEVIAETKAEKAVYDELELSELDARVEGNAAVVTGVNRVRGKDGQGKPMDRRFRFTDTYIKRDGRWQVWATQATPIK